MTDQLQPRFDMGRAYQALDIDYSQYPLRDRRTMLLTHLEQCIEPAPEPHPTVPDTLHLALAGWVVLTAIVALLLAPQLWPLEILSILIGGYAIYGYIRTHPHHRKENR